MTRDEYRYLLDMKEADDREGQGMLGPSKAVLRPLDVQDMLARKGHLRVEHADDPLFSAWGGAKHLTTKGLRALQREARRRQREVGGG